MQNRFGICITFLSTKDQNYKTVSVFETIFVSLYKNRRHYKRPLKFSKSNAESRFMKSRRNKPTF